MLNKVSSGSWSDQLSSLFAFSQLPHMFDGLPWNVSGCMKELDLAPRARDALYSLIGLVPSPRTTETLLRLI